MQKKERVVGIVTMPVTNAGFIPLLNLVDIIKSLSENIHVITGGIGANIPEYYKECNVHVIKHKIGTNPFKRIVYYIHTQIKYSLKIVSCKNVDLWIFFIGGDTLLLPMIAAKLLRKKVVLASACSILQCSKANNDRISNFVSILEHINRLLANCIVLHSSNLITDWNLEKYRNKIRIGHEYFLDFNEFRPKCDISKRKNLIGFVGRLSGEKGVLNFVYSIIEILNIRDDVEFLIIGEGNLREEIERYLAYNNLNNKVHLTGWVEHEKLPDCLNSLKLLVIPSYTESGPIIALEAMACDTPILATQVGHILKMVDDGKTGFIMEDNSPKCIAKNILRVLEFENIETITKSARYSVSKYFSYNAALETYRMILDDI
ncbi:glycosyltransferase family 4 protein [Methanococcoides seepicolus]|uniref:Glycosyltransferase family 4 protein n=2 Tax=Methanococcoides seepicolus TaxID=2828780 RepID=A0A9E5DBG4_9EURY|nr:glycosyltransferase family 4 protein [Methanococcoides seepicolus]